MVGPDKRIVLVCQKGASWSFPKGGIEEGETPLEAATREILEETGISDLTFVKELGAYMRNSINKEGTGEDPGSKVRTRTIFLFRTNASELLHKDPDGEITEARFVTLDEASALLTHPKDKEFLAAVRDTIEQ